MFCSLFNETVIHFFILWNLNKTSDQKCLLKGGFEHSCLVSSKFMLTVTHWHCSLWSSEDVCSLLDVPLSVLWVLPSSVFTDEGKTVFHWFKMFIDLNCTVTEWEVKMALMVQISTFESLKQKKNQTVNNNACLNHTLKKSVITVWFYTVLFCPSSSVYGTVLIYCSHF